MTNEFVWVVGFNRVTGKRETFVCCSSNNSKFYEELYIGEGYDVKILNGDEVDELIKQEKKENHLS